MNGILNKPKGYFPHKRSLEFDVYRYELSALIHKGQRFCDPPGLPFWPQDSCCSSKSKKERHFFHTAQNPGVGWAWGLGPGLKISPSTLIPLGWLQHDQGWDSTFQLTFTQTDFYLNPGGDGKLMALSFALKVASAFLRAGPPKPQPPLLTCKA